MPRRLLPFLLALLLCLSAAASPAGRSRIVLRQADGSRIEALLGGDEWHKTLTTLSGEAIALADDGCYHYIYYHTDGHRILTPWKAGDPATPPAIRARAAHIPQEAIARLAAQKRDVALRQREIRRRLVRTAGFPAEQRILVLLVQFSDLKFRYTQEDFELLLEGDARRYFNDQFASVGTQFHVDVAPLVTLPNRYAYYGKNDTSGSDTNPHLMVRDACQAVDASVDFSQYDTDGDGILDNVFLFFAGADEAEGAGDDHLWSHHWYLRDGAGLTLRLDGVLINSYACTSELMYTSRGTTTRAGIGTFCHEYSHSFGLPDFYDTDYEGSGGLSEGLWGSLSLMDGGNRNESSMRPPNYTVVERWLLGLCEPQPLQAGETRLSPGDDGLILEAAKSGECYLFECRSNDGWDSAIGSKGLLIYHVDRSDNNAGGVMASSRWKANTLNCNPLHPCVDLIEADPSVIASFAEARANGRLRDYVHRCFFPLSAHTAFTPNTQPAFTFWNGSASSLSLSDIRFDGDDILFTVGESETMRLPEVATLSGDVFQDAAILSWTTDIPEYYASSWLSWGPTGKDAKEIEVKPYAAGHYAVTLEGLEAKKAYTVTAYFKSGGSPVNTRSFSFTTKSVYTGSSPFIWLPKTGRNADGSFAPGARLPLRIYHLPAGTAVSWRFDGEDITVGTDGYFTVPRSGRLQAILTDAEGNESLLLKILTVR